MHSAQRPQDGPAAPLFRYSSGSFLFSLASFSSSLHCFDLFLSIFVGGMFVVVVLLALMTAVMKKPLAYTAMMN